MSDIIANHRQPALSKARLFDRLGLVFTVLGLLGLLLPFATFRQNRIVQGEPRFLFDALPVSMASLLLIIMIALSL